MLGHLRTLVPGQRLAQLFGQRRNLCHDSITYRFSTMAGQGWAILYTETEPPRVLWRPVGLSQAATVEA